MPTVIKKTFSVCLYTIVLSLPLVSYAAEALTKTTELIKAGITVLNTVLAAVFVLALIVFAWGVVKYISAAGDAAKIKDSKAFLFWGIIGVFVLASMWGLIKFIADELTIAGPETQGTILPLKINTR